MKKTKITALAAALLLLLALLTGCGSDTVETVVGTWESPDGYTLELTEDMLTLTNDSHENALAYEALPYEWTGNTLAVTIEEQTYPVFETYLSEDTLKLTYLSALDDSEKPASITLTRVKEDDGGLLASCAG